MRFLEERGADDELIRAAWLHDAGKMKTKRFDKKRDRDTFYNHAKESAKIAEELGESEHVVALVRWHDSFFSHPDLKKLAVHGRKWCDDLAMLMLADLSAQHPTFEIAERLEARGSFLMKLYKQLDFLENGNKSADTEKVEKQPKKRKRDPNDIELRIRDVRPYTCEGESGVYFLWTSKIGFGCYTLSFRQGKSMEEECDRLWVADSECMDDFNDQAFGRKLLELWMDQILVID